MRKMDFQQIDQKKALLASKRPLPPEIIRNLKQGPRQELLLQRVSYADDGGDRIGTPLFPWTFPCSVH